EEGGVAGLREKRLDKAAAPAPKTGQPENGLTSPSENGSGEVTRKRVTNLSKANLGKATGVMGAPATRAAGGRSDSNLSGVRLDLMPVHDPIPPQLFTWRRLAGGPLCLRRPYSSGGGTGGRAPAHAPPPALRGLPLPPSAP